MANCISCGRPLPAFTFGQRRDVCDTCRASAVEVSVAGGMGPGMPGNTGVKRRGSITTVLVGLNVAVFVMMILSGVSFTSPNSRQLLTWGANFGLLSLTSEPWRLVTSNYLHIGIIHIAFNMWCLWDLGHLAELIFDGWTYVLTYTVCGIAGSLASLWWHPMVVGAGASGAIFGLAGALIAALYLGKLPVPKQAVQQTLKSLLTFAGYNLFFGAALAGVDNSAHIGGLVAGLILGAVLAKHLNSSEEDRKRWRFGVFTLSAVLLVLSYLWVRQSFRRALLPGSSTTQQFISPVPYQNPAKSMTIKG